MEWTNRVRDEWPAIVIVAIMLLAAFAVPILGPLRSSGSRVIIAIAVLLVGAGLALLVERSEPMSSAPEQLPQSDSPDE